MRVKGRGHRARELLDRPDAKHGQSLLMVQPRLSGPLDLAFHRVAWSCVVSYLREAVWRCMMYGVYGCMAVCAVCAV